MLQRYNLPFPNSGISDYYNAKMGDRDFKKLAKFKITRWDVLPVEKGIISFYDSSGKKVAEGTFKAILLCEPEIPRLDMAYSPDFQYMLEILNAISIPTIDPIKGMPSRIYVDYTDDVEEIAFYIGDHVNADFVIEKNNVFFAVFGFKEWVG